MGLQAYANIYRPNKENEVILLNEQTKKTILSAFEGVYQTYFDDPNNMFNSYIAFASELREAEALEAKDLVTLKEWLDWHDIELNKSDLHAIALRISRNFKEHYGHLPRKITRPDKNNRWVLRATAFQMNQLHILEQSYKELFGEEPPPVKSDEPPLL